MKNKKIPPLMGIPLGILALVLIVWANAAPSLPIPVSFGMRVLALGCATLLVYDFSRSDRSES